MFFTQTLKPCSDKIQCALQQRGKRSEGSEKAPMLRGFFMSGMGNVLLGCGPEGEWTQQKKQLDFGGMDQPRSRMRQFELRWLEMP